MPRQFRISRADVEHFRSLQLAPAAKAYEVLKSKRERIDRLK